MYFLPWTLQILMVLIGEAWKGNFSKLKKCAYNWYKNSLVKAVFSDSCKRILKSQLDMHKQTEKKASLPLNASL